jgi:hypothetical protein
LKAFLLHSHWLDGFRCRALGSFCRGCVCVFQFCVLAC